MTINKNSRIPWSLSQWTQVEGIGPRLEDLKFPFESTRRGATSKPDYDFTENGLLFPQNDPDEKTYAVGQMPHAWKEGTIIYPHIHIAQDEAAIPIFKLDYRWYNNGDLIPAGYTTLSTDDGDGPVSTYVSGNLAQILPFPAIDGSGFKISSIIDIILYRDDNVVTGDVLGKEFDIHYVVNSRGSRQEFIK